MCSPSARPCKAANLIARFLWFSHTAASVTASCIRAAPAGICTAGCTGANARVALNWRQHDPRTARLLPHRRYVRAALDPGASAPHRRLNMVNDETVYWQAGYTAGRAAKHHDAALARMQREWLSKAKLVEAAKDRALADAAYKRGYEEAAHI